MGSKARARLKVSGTDYGMATAEVRNTTTKAGSPTEMGSAAEMGTPTTEMRTPTTAAEVAATTTPEMATTAPTAATVSSSGTGRHGGAHSKCGYGKDLESPGQKSCLSHLGRHGDFTPSLHAIRRTRGTEALAIRRSATAIVQAPGTRAGSLLRYGLPVGTFPVAISTVSLYLKNAGEASAMTGQPLS
jgi:hypothetical protein